MITIEKAIETLGDYKRESGFEATPDFEAALKLGIEALKYYEHYRKTGFLSPRLRLPGETKE